MTDEGELPLADFEPERETFLREVLHGLRQPAKQLPARHAIFEMSIHHLSQQPGAPMSRHNRHHRQASHRSHDAARYGQVEGKRRGSPHQGVAIERCGGPPEINLAQESLPGLVVVFGIAAEGAADDSAKCRDLLLGDRSNLDGHVSETSRQLTARRGLV